MHIDLNSFLPLPPWTLQPCLPFLQSAVKRLNDLFRDDGVFRQLSNAPGTLHGASKLLGDGSLHRMLCTLPCIASSALVMSCDAGLWPNRTCVTCLRAGRVPRQDRRQGDWRQEGLGCEPFRSFQACCAAGLQRTPHRSWQTLSDSSTPAARARIVTPSCPVICVSNELAKFAVRRLNCL